MSEGIKGVFNSPLEAGLRCLAILTAGYPNNYDLSRLVFYDYMLVHSGDIAGGPESLHPATPHRSGEILIRRPVLESGLNLFLSKGLINVIYNQDGILYSATELSSPFLDSLSSEYVSKLKNNAYWLVDSFDIFDIQSIQEMINRNIGNWGGEFISESIVRREMTL
jgi:hypothetical protein